MRCLFVCADDFLWRLAGERGETRLAPVWIVEESRLRARIVERGAEALAGRLDGEHIYRRAYAITEAEYTRRREQIISEI